MKALALVLLVLSVPRQEAQTRFVVLDVYADAAQPVAAWQVEIECDPSQAKIVGVESVGQPPYYDPAALMGGRIILASFTTDAPPPAGRRLVARVHFQETGSPRYSAKLMAAAAPGGERIEPKVDLVRAGGK